jgi:hypothetical protein
MPRASKTENSTSLGTEQVIMTLPAWPGSKLVRAQST